jgi:hypothetical protein
MGTADRCRLARLCDHLGPRTAPCCTRPAVPSAAATHRCDDADPIAAWRAELPELIERYNADGYVLVSGLIGPEVHRPATDAIWAAMEDPSDHWLTGESQGGLQRRDRSTWPAEPKQFARSVAHPAVSALWTPAYRAMAEALAAGFVPERDTMHLPDVPITAPGGALAINIFPMAAPAEGWSWPSPHIDHSIENHGYRTFPRPVRMSTMTYISPSPGEGAHGGSTVVWKGSHRAMERLAAADPKRFELMHPLGGALEEAGVLELEKVEINVQAGDVLFYDVRLSCPRSWPACYANAHWARLMSDVGADLDSAFWLAKLCRWAQAGVQYEVGDQGSGSFGARTMICARVTN